MTTTKTPIVEVLEAAREKVRKGWCQGGFRDFGNGLEECRYCAEGAILYSLGGACELANTKAGARELIRHAIGTEEIYLWNDAPERTQAEVVDAFTKAIELARSEEAAK